MDKLHSWLDKRPLTSHILLLMVGGYLLYDVFNLYKSLPDHSGSPMPVYVFMALFSVTGAVMLLFGIYAVVTGHYREKVLPAGPVSDDHSEGAEE